MPPWLLTLDMVPLLLALAALYTALRVLLRRRHRPRIEDRGGRVDTDGYLRLKRKLDS